MRFVYGDQYDEEVALNNETETEKSMKEIVLMTAEWDKPSLREKTLLL